MKSVLSFPPMFDYIVADKCFITCFCGIFRSVRNSHLFLDFDQRKGSVLGSNLGRLAPQSHALLTVPLPRKNQYFLSNIEWIKYHSFSSFPFEQVVRATVLPLSNMGGKSCTQRVRFTFICQFMIQRPWVWNFLITKLKEICRRMWMN